ncbi:MAG: Anti-sigma-K factor rskA [Mucilaginibacter sp.]|nr:Anti-sigma-K factor rskA [Mucilaginibacter sp.]
MDEVKAYIETGILELYVLGDITPEERLQVEAMIAAHPAVKAEIAEIEKAMELYADANAVDPSEYQRGKILNSLLTNLADDRTFTAKNKVNTTDSIISMPPSRANNFYKYAFTASIILLAASIIALYQMHNQLMESNTQLAILTSQNQRFSKTVNLMDEQLGVFRDTCFKVVRLKPTGKVPNIGITVAWNPVKKKVMIDMATMKMPKNDKTHQYQLWALVGGKPVDLGVFDKTASDTTAMKQMKSIASADAFAVTLEPRGGSINPTMSEMMVLGKF